MKKLAKMALVGSLSCLMSLPVLADLDDGLIAHYPFDGNSQDVSGNSKNATEYGGITYTNGKTGSAAHFDGQDDYISIGTVLVNQCQFTFSIWVNITEVLHPDYFGIFGQQEFSYPLEHNTSYAFYIGNSSAFGSSSGWTDAESFDTRTSHVVPVKEWHLITQTYDGQTIKQFDNGILINTLPSQNKCLGNDSDFLIGKVAAYPGTLHTSYFSGLADDFRIYNRALSETEIQQLYKGESTSASGNCMASYSPSGQLHVPCVSVPDAFGGTTVYDIKLNQQSGSFTFDLDMGSVKPK